MTGIRRCRDDERGEILAIVNAAAGAYRGVIPEDRWHEPYMEERELEAQVAEGVEFWGYEDGGRLVGVMGIQRLEDVDLIRHAYVLPSEQGRGIGRDLLRYLQGLTDRPILIGTWASRRRVGPRCFAATGTSRSVRSRRRSCSRARRSTRRSSP